MKKLILAVALSLSSPVMADVNKDLSTFFNKLGSSSNASRNGVYQDQSAGYYTGGSLFARNTVHTSQLASIRMPGYRAGCGGIDMHFGALSFIKSEELVKALKAVGSNMASYALLLAIETMSPQVKNIMTELNDLAQRVNQSNINSCELAATTLGSVLPKSDVANRHLCTMIGSDSRYGGFSDYASARQGCGAGGTRDQVLAMGRNDPRFKDMLGTEFNLAWQAIMQNEWLKSDPRLAEFFMSLSGTLVSRKDGEDYVIRPWNSLSAHESQLKAMLHGGRAVVYKCYDREGSQCLDVRKEEVEILPENSLVLKARKILRSIQDKILTDSALSDSEKEFLNSTRLPFYKLLNVSTAYRKGASPLTVDEYAELAAVDILYKYIHEVLDVVLQSLAHLKGSQVDSAHLTNFQRELNNARTQVYRHRMGSFQAMEQLFGLIRKTELIEKTISVKMGVLAAEGM